jgi:hypothetical protein
VESSPPKRGTFSPPARRRARYIPPMMCCSAVLEQLWCDLVAVTVPSASVWFTGSVLICDYNVFQHET